MVLSPPVDTYLVPVAGGPPKIVGMSEWKPLSRGGFATVWQARQESLDRFVAVKVDGRPLIDETEQRRFLREAKAAGQLSGHPGIVTVHDAGILADDRPYLVMELCPAGSLTSWLSPENRQSPERIREVGVRIADALAAAHARGMLHRDVKPANIMIDGYGNPGLADFGMAALSEPGSDQPALEGITPAYAPVEALHRQPATEFSDVYQLAATLYALLGGRSPHFAGSGTSSLPELIERHKEPVPPIPGVDPDLMAVVLSGLSENPAERPTAAQFRDRLADIGPKPVDRPRPRVRRLVLVLLVAAVLTALVVVLGGTGVYLYEIDRSVTENISRGIDLPVDDGPTPRPVKDPTADQTLDYLLIGADDGDPDLDQDGRSDSIMIVHLNQDRDQAYVVSVPRDTWVDIPGHGEDKVNTAYSLGGPALVVSTVESLTGARIDHVAMMDFAGFVGLTDDLGGVTVNNRIEFTSHGHHFPTGRISIAGDEALWFVREHRALPSERDRAENQRNVLKAILAKGMSSEVITDPKRFTNFVGNAAKHIRVDNALSDRELRSTALSLRLKPENIQLLTVPLGKPGKVDGRTAERVDPAQMRELSEALRKDTMSDYVKKYPRG